MNKRLYKSQNKMIAGVCAGIGEYFGIDPTIVRLGFIILLVVGVGIPFLVYIIGLVIIPDRPFSSSEQQYEEEMKSANEYDRSDEEFDKYFKKDKIDDKQ
ncbi:MAG: PspC domain-containing protein [Treponemataceae bacterium]|nr:PspC domain-containing protein [Treponemataceae bacterium]